MKKAPLPHDDDDGDGRRVSKRPCHGQSDHAMITGTVTVASGHSPPPIA